jgi:hypothetical protein
MLILLLVLKFNILSLVWYLRNIVYRSFYWKFPPLGIVHLQAPFIFLNPCPSDTVVWYFYKPVEEDCLRQSKVKGDCLRLSEAMENCLRQTSTVRNRLRLSYSCSLLKGGYLRPSAAVLSLRPQNSRLPEAVLFPDQLTSMLICVPLTYKYATQIFTS